MCNQRGEENYEGAARLCINLCQDIRAKLQPTVSSVVGAKQASTPCKKRGHAVPQVSSVDSSAKRGEHQQFKSKKNSIVQ